MIKYIDFKIKGVNLVCNNCTSQNDVKTIEIRNVTILMLCKDCRRKLKELLKEEKEHD